MTPERHADLWALQRRHGDDRERFFRAVAGSVPARSVLYPGSFVDLTASFVWDDVTYVDLDRRAAAFFAERDAVEAIVAEHTARAERTWRFVHADYTDPLPVEPRSVDLLVSMYAGFVSGACGHHLRIGGHLVVHPSHGDVALAAQDPRFALVGAVWSRRGGYAVDRRALDTYLVPKREVELTEPAIRTRGRGVAYTRSPYAYVFRRTA